jgi:soluble lytic murein transglycosylase-like protein
LFQLLDSTGKELLEQLGIDDDYDPFDPALNSYLGVGYLRRLHDTFSKETKLTNNLSTAPARTADDLEKLAIAAFNTGEGNVARAQEKAAQEGKIQECFQT